MRLYLHLFLACFCLFSCQRQQAARNQVKFLTLDAADRSKIPHVADFLALYPHATIGYLEIPQSPNLLIPQSPNFPISHQPFHLSPPPIHLGYPR